MVKTEIRDVDLTLAERTERDMTNGLGYDSRSTYGLNPETDSKTIELIHDTPEGFQAHLALMESRTGWPSLKFYFGGVAECDEGKFIGRVRVDSKDSHYTEKITTVECRKLAELAELNARGNFVTKDYSEALGEIGNIEASERLQAEREKLLNTRDLYSLSEMKEPKCLEEFLIPNKLTDDMLIFRLYKKLDQKDFEKFFEYDSFGRRRRDLDDPLLSEMRELKYLEKYFIPEKLFDDDKDIFSPYIDKDR